MAYLLGMILGNGEVQQDERSTRVTIDIPHKNLYTDDMREAAVYVRASLMDIQYILEPLLGQHLTHTSLQHSTKVSFEKPNDEYVMREILRLIGAGTHHSTMRMNEELFSISTDEKKALLRGVADVTGYIRKSNIAFGQDGAHRVYIEIPGNWYMVIDIANMLKAVDIPGSVKTIERNAFRFANLTNVTIQQGVGTINSDAFGKVHAKILSKSVVLASRAFLGGSTITCYKGSTAERYAVSNNMTVKYITETKTLKKSPKPSVKIKGGVMIIACKAVTDADGYQVRYATNASMKNAVTISGSKVSVANLKKGKTYYVQARAYKKGAKKTYGAWSDKVKKKL